MQLGLPKWFSLKDKFAHQTTAVEKQARKSIKPSKRFPSHKPSSIYFFKAGYSRDQFQADVLERILEPLQTIKMHRPGHEIYERSRPAGPNLFASSFTITCQGFN